MSSHHCASVTRAYAPYSLHFRNVNLIALRYCAGCTALDAPQTASSGTLQQIALAPSISPGGLLKGMNNGSLPDPYPHSVREAIPSRKCSMLSVLRCCSRSEHAHTEVLRSLQSPVRYSNHRRLQDAHQTRRIVPRSAPNPASMSLAQPLPTAERSSPEITRWFPCFDCCPKEGTKPSASKGQEYRLPSQVRGSSENAR